jgi:hypothetical protein
MNFFSGPFRSLDNRRTRREIDEELQFHLDLLTEENYRQNIPWDEAQDRALNRFGNIEQIRDECLRIARRNQPAIWALKWFFGFVFVTGVLVHIFSTEYHVTRVGNILMEIGALARLLLYLRGRMPLRYVKGNDQPTTLELNGSPPSIAAYDKSGRTPVERIVSAK